MMMIMSLSNPDEEYLKKTWKKRDFNAVFHCTLYTTVYDRRFVDVQAVSIVTARQLLLVYRR